MRAQAQANYLEDEEGEVLPARREDALVVGLGGLVLFCHVLPRRVVYTFCHVLPRPAVPRLVHLAEEPAGPAGSVEASCVLIVEEHLGHRPGKLEW